MSAGLDLRREARHGVGVGADELERRLAGLRGLGFDEESADRLFEAIDLPATEKISARLDDLRALGFENPVKMITSLPAILGYAIDNIRGKLDDLRALGFENPVKMITSSPAILGYAIDNIRGKLDDLRALGFENPVKMITSLPAILGYAIDNIRGKLDDLRALGFENPVKMITSSPAILGYAIDRLRLVVSIVNACADAPPSAFSSLVYKRRSLIEEIAASKPASWADVRAALRAAKIKKEASAP